MGTIVQVKPVKLFFGFIYNHIDIFEKTKKILNEEFGDIDLISDCMNFNFTDYYNQEMGTDLKRSFISLRELIDPVNLRDIKIFSNEIESKFLKLNHRLINIDPGYLDSAKVVLASTKDYSHRMYIGKGIYAEVTMHYESKQYKFHPWTYPDYKSKEYLNFFYKLRETYRKQIIRQQ